jgi:hypothetical protein
MKKLIKFLKNNWMWFVIGVMMFYIAHPKGGAHLMGLF